MSDPVSHVANPPYPNANDFASCVSVVIGAMKGDPTELSCLLHCGWVCVGFALSQAAPHGPHVMSAANLALTEMTTLLEDAKAESLKPASGVQAIAFPWAVVVDILLSAIIEWVRKQQQ